jgi:single-stranded-DNA-specific exonuclease
MTNTLKRWAIKPAADSELVNKLAGELNLETRLANLLAQRGVSTFEEARSFFRPALEDLHDPFLMLGMDKAVARIISGIENGERIMIYGDYDVDGTTAVALVFSFFKEFYSQNIEYYIPDRYTEGYGISFQGIDSAATSGVNLIIALDCGIRSVDKVNYANEKSINFIICDHHLPGDELPAAIAILDPKQNNCSYPYKELSGCGIGFKLIQALAPICCPAFDVYKTLDLVATSIAADIVPITGENRIMAYFGLKQINSAPRPGIKALLKPAKESVNYDTKAEVNKPEKEITIESLVFTAAPRINAAGRIDHGRKAVELLIAETEAAAQEVSLHVNVQNGKRKDLDKLITEEALAILASNPAYRDTKSTVLFKADWHKGVVGIVASRVLEKFYRPTIVLTESNGMATGSARSVNGFDIHDAISQCAELLEQFGGHKYAAGMTLKLENVERFRQKFETVVSARITDEQLIPVVEIDMELNPDEINPKFYRILKQFAPFGPGNMAPVFLTKSLVDDGYARIVGGNHLKLKLGKSGQPFFDAIAFGMGEHLAELSKRIPVDVCYSLEENHWNGNVTLQWMVKDIKC